MKNEKVIQKGATIQKAATIQVGATIQKGTTIQKEATIQKGVTIQNGAPQTKHEPFWSDGSIMTWTNLERSDMARTKAIPDTITPIRQHTLID